MLIVYGLVIMAIIQDFKAMRISNRLILLGMGIALMRRILCEGIMGVFTGCILISIPVILLYLLFLAGVLGAGDIKLFSLIGGFVNFKVLIWCMVYSFLWAAVFSLMKMLYYGIFVAGMKMAMNYLRALMEGKVHAYVAMGDKYKIHFSVAILLGLFTAHWLKW